MSLFHVTLHCFRLATHRAQVCGRERNMKHEAKHVHHDLKKFHSQSPLTNSILLPDLHTVSILMAQNHQCDQWRRVGDTNMMYILRPDLDVAIPQHFFCYNINRNTRAPECEVRGKAVQQPASRSQRMEREMHGPLSLMSFLLYMMCRNISMLYS